MDIAFTPQVNEYRGMQSVQFVLCDIRPDERCRAEADADEAVYLAVQQGTAQEAELRRALPQRGEFIAVWKYLASHSEENILEEDFCLLCRNIARFSGLPCSVLRTHICLDVFAEQGLLKMKLKRTGVHIRLTCDGKKADLNQSSILADIRRQLHE